MHPLRPKLPELAKTRIITQGPMGSVDRTSTRLADQEAFDALYQALVDTREILDRGIKSGVKSYKGTLHKARDRVWEVT